MRYGNQWLPYLNPYPIYGSYRPRPPSRMIYGMTNRMNVPNFRNYGPVINSQKIGRGSFRTRRNNIRGLPRNNRKKYNKRTESNDINLNNNTRNPMTIERIEAPLTTGMNVIYGSGKLKNGSDRMLSPLGIFTVSNQPWVIVPAHPLLLTQNLTKVACMYDSYSISSMTVRWIPSCGANCPGTTRLAFIKGPNGYSNSTVPATLFGQIAVTTNNVECPTWTMGSITKKFSNKKYPMVPHDPNNDYMGTFIVMVSDLTVTDITALGTVAIDLVYRLYDNNGNPQTTRINDYNEYNVAMGGLTLTHGTVKVKGFGVIAESTANSVQLGEFAQFPSIAAIGGPADPSKEMLVNSEKIDYGDNEFYGNLSVIAFVTT